MAPARSCSPTISKSTIASAWAYRARARNGLRSAGVCKATLRMRTAGGGERTPPAKSISAICSTLGCATWPMAAPQCARPHNLPMARKPKRPPRSAAIRVRRPIARRPRSTPPPAAGLDLHRCEQFLILEARLLDEGKFDEWLALFTPDAWYWVPSYDDRRLLETRVRRLASPRMYSQEPRSRTSRIVSNVTIETNDRNACTVRSKFVMIEFRREQQRIVAGTARHRLVQSGGRIMIAWKRVDLVNCDAPLDGFTIPF